MSDAGREETAGRGTTDELVDVKPDISADFSNKISLPPVTAYAGNDHKLITFNKWKEDIELIVDIHNFKTAQTGIKYALIQTSGSARIAARSYIKDTAEGSQTLAGLFKAIKKACIPSTVEQAMIHRYNSIRQYTSGHSRPITEVAQEMRDLLIQLSLDDPMPERLQISRFMEAMSYDLRQVVEPNVTDNMGWEEVVALAERHDAVQHQIAKRKGSASKKKKNTNNNGGKPSSSATKPKRFTNLKPKGNSPQKTFTKLTDAERERITRNGGCVY